MWGRSKMDETLTLDSGLITRISSAIAIPPLR